MDIRDVNIALCREHLHPRNAKLAERDVLTLVPLTDVEELNVEWGPFSTPSNFPQFKEFLRFFTWPTNADHPKIAKSFVEGDAPDFVAMVIQGEQFRDRWRMVAIRERKEEIRPGEIQFFLKLTLRKGFVEVYDASALRVRRLTDKQGTTDTIDNHPATDGTDAGRNPGLVMLLEMPNVSRKSVQEVIDGFPVSFATGTTIDDYKVPAGRTLYKTIATHDKQEDGSSTITAIYADEQFAFNGFEDNNVITERKIGYLWNVPRQLGETLADAWDEASSTRRGCTASLSGEGQGYLNLIFTSKVGAKDNLTTSWVPTSCDSFKRYHFAWGHTKDELYDPGPPGAGFIASHDDAIDGTTLSPGSTGKVIRSRQVNVNNRGDGLYDAIITETSWADPSPVTYDYSITLGIGTKITSQKLYGYNWPLGDSGMGHATFKAQFETGAVGKTHNLTIRRDEDDCSFDWEGTITTVTKVDSDQRTKQPAALEGVGNIIQAVAHATANEIGTELSGYTPAIGKSLQIQLSSNDDETFGAVFREVTEQSPEISGGFAEGEDVGLGVTLLAGDNVDAAAVASALTNTDLTGSGIGITHEIRVTPKPDGGFSYTLVERRERNPALSEDVSKGENAGIGQSVSVGKNATEEEVVTAISALSPGIGVAHTIRVTPNGDGGFDYGFVETTTQSPSMSKEAVEPEDYSDGTGTGVVLSSGHNRTLAQFQAALGAFASEARKSLRVQVSGGDDGGWDYTIVETQVQALSGSKSFGDSTLYWGMNTSAPAARSSVVLQSSSVVGNSDGTYNYSILVRPLHADTSDAEEAISNKRYVQTGLNQGSVATPSGARILSYSVGRGENGTFNYSITSRDLEEVTDSASDGGEGVTRDVSAGLHSTSLPDISSSRLKRDYLSGLTPEEGGKFSWTRIQDGIVETGPTTWNIGSRGEQTAVIVAKNVESLTDPSVTGASSKGLSVAVDAVYDNAGNLTYVMRTTQMEAQSATVYGGTYTEKQKTEHKVGDVTQDELGTDTHPVEGTTVLWQARMKADGSLDWSKSTGVTTARTVSGITLKRLKPKVANNGFTETATTFKNVTGANMGDYDIADDTYGYIAHLVMHPNGNLSGVKVVVKYEREGADLDSIGLPSGSFSYLKESEYKIGDDLYIYTQEYSVSVHTGATYSGVGNDIDGGVGGAENIDLMDFYGDKVWVGWKVTRIGSPSLIKTIDITTGS